MCHVRLAHDGSDMSSDEGYDEHSVKNLSLSLEVVGQGWSGRLVYLFLEDWELAHGAAIWHKTFVSRSERALVVVVLLPLLPTVAVFFKSLPSNKGCNSEEWHVMGEHQVVSSNEELRKKIGKDVRWSGALAVDVAPCPSVWHW